jgi:serine/threonine-protein kinase
MSSSSANILAAADMRIGAWLRGKYRVDRVLGMGGMAVVYAVTHRNGRRFALKMLHPELSVRSDIRKRFLREGYIANQVGHPGAVAVLDDDTAEDGSAFLVMELLEGETLDVVLARKPGGLPLDQSLAIAHGLLDVLAASHAKQIVHRDIKPGNLFVTTTGDVKVLDFGIARLRQPDGVDATRSGVAMGTPAFMSPEQAMGKVVDSRSDLFSAGATIFTLLTGRNVHTGDTGQELMVKAATEPAPALASVRPDVPSAVATIVDRALAFAPHDRWESAAAMRDAVGGAFETVTGEPVSPASVAPALTARRAAPRRLDPTPDAPSSTVAAVPESRDATTPRAPVQHHQDTLRAATRPMTPLSTDEPVASEAAGARQPSGAPASTNALRVATIGVAAAAVVVAAVFAFVRTTTRQAADAPPASALPAQTVASQPAPPASEPTAPTAATPTASATAPEIAPEPAHTSAPSASASASAPVPWWAVPRRPSAPALPAGSTRAKPADPWAIP